jgi:hypothetical protein
MKIGRFSLTIRRTATVRDEKLAKVLWQSLDRSHMKTAMPFWSRLNRP